MTLHDLLSAYETALARGDAPTPEEACREHPELLDKFRQHAKAIRTIAAPTAAAFAETMSSRSAEATAVRLDACRPYARGGLGEVYKAHDAGLGRDVALKVMAGPADTARRRSFEREAAITARLEHPGIVPIYGTATDDRGRPGHVMRFVAGPTLHEAIEQFHASKPTWSRSDPALRQLLGRLVQVAQTIAFAHSRGVVHRDLKPGNIILGDYGETIVIDWGLAKDLNAKSPENVADALPARDIETQAGTVVGTPAYLSPEQARGEDATPATDIYALGGLLFSVLTNTAPYGGMALDERLRRQEAGDVPTAQSRNTATPSGLNALCAKAMAAKPTERYADARDFAAEIDRWLADEPLICAPDSLTTRLRRWTKRNRLLVTTSLAALVVAAVGLGVSTLLLNRKNEDLQKSVEAEQARAKEARDASALATTREAEAFENFKTACFAVDDFAMKVNNDPRLRTADFLALRKDFLESASKFYRQLGQRRGNEMPLLRRIANSQIQLARVYLSIGEFDNVEREYRAALAVMDRESDSDRATRDHHLYLSGIWLGLGGMMRERGEFTGSLEAMKKARTEKDLAFRDTPMDAAEADDTAILDMHLAAAIACVQGASPEAVGAYQRVIDYCTAALASRPQVTGNAVTRIVARRELGDLLSDHAQTAAAVEQWKLALAESEGMKASDADEVHTVREQRVKILLVLSGVAQTNRDWATAEANIRTALGEIDTLLKNNARDYAARVNRAKALGRLGLVQLERGDATAGVATLRLSLEYRVQLHAARPEGSIERQALVEGRANLARALAATTDFENAHKELSAAAAMVKPVASDAGLAKIVVRGWSQSAGPADSKANTTAFEACLAMVQARIKIDKPSQTLALLQEMQKAGLWENPERRQRLNDPALAPLKDLPEFQKLMTP